MRPLRRNEARGFTLVELLMVVAIIGSLASVAIPSFRALTIRAKKSERAVVVNGIERAIFEYVSEHDSYPNPAGPGTSFIFLADDPPWPFSPLKKPFDPTQPGWSTLNYQPTGTLYYHYYCWGWMAPNWAYFYVRTVGDLDANGIFSWYYKWWWRDATGNWYLQEFQNPPGEE